MRPSAGTPYLARVPETAARAQDREAAISVVEASCFSPLGNGFSNPADRPTAERPMLALVKRLPTSRRHDVRRRRSAQRPRSSTATTKADSACPGIPRRPVGRELTRVFSLAAKSSQTSIRC